MKKKLTITLLAVLLMFSMGTIVMAGIDLEGEMNYEIGNVITDGYTQIATTLAPEPFDFKLTWRRDWIPTVEDSLLMDTGISMGDLRLGYTKELMAVDVGTASLKLTKDPFTVEYARTVDWLDSGTLTVELAVAPFTFKYTNAFNGTSGGIFVRFEKSI